MNESRCIGALFLIHSQYYYLLILLDISSFYLKKHICVYEFCKADSRFVLFYVKTLPVFHTWAELFIPVQMQFYSFFRLLNSVCPPKLSFTWFEGKKACVICQYYEAVCRHTQRRRENSFANNLYVNHSLRPANYRPRHFARHIYCSGLFLVCVCAVETSETMRPTSYTTNC